MANVSIDNLRRSITIITQVLMEKDFKVTQRGTKAYVEADHNGIPHHINIPYIPDGASEELILAINGFLDHEVAHVMFTDFKECQDHIFGGGKIGKIRRNIFNVLEDGRIEKLMEKRFAGSAFNLNGTGEFVICRSINPDFLKAKESGDESELINSLFTCVMRSYSGTKAFQSYMDEGNKWQFVTPLTDKINHLVGDIESLSSTGQTVMLALLIADLIVKKPPKEKPPEEKPPEHDEPEESDESPKPKEPDESDDSDDSQEPSEGSDGEGESESSDENEHGGSDDELDGDDEESEGFEPKNDETKNDGSEEEPNDGLLDDLKDSGDEINSQNDDEPNESENEESNGDSPEDDDGGEKQPSDAGESDGDDEPSEESEPSKSKGEDDGEGGDDSGSDNKEGDDNSDATPYDEFETGGEGGEAQQPESDGDEEMEDDDLFYGLEDVRDMSDDLSEIIERDSRDAFRSGGYRVFSTDFDRVMIYEPVSFVSMNTMKRVLGNFEDLTKKNGGALQKTLERLMKSKTPSRNVPGKTSGRVNQQSLFRLRTGDMRVFKRREMGHSKDVAVSLVVDMSGSMNLDRKYETALESAYALCSVLSKLNITCEVIGFTTLNDDITHGERTVAWSRTEPLYMPILKSFDEKFGPEQKARFSNIYRNKLFLRNNIDGECVAIAASRLVNMTKEVGKKMIVLSDGNPAGYGIYKDIQYHAESEIKRIESMGVDIIGIGIVDDAVKHFYKNNVVINKVSDLPEVLIKKLKEMIM